MQIKIIINYLLISLFIISTPYLKAQQYISFQEGKLEYSYSKTINSYTLSIYNSSKSCASVQWKANQGINIEKSQGSLTIKSNQTEYVSINVFDQTKDFKIGNILLTATKCDGILAFEGGKLEYEYSQSNHSYVLSIHNHSKSSASVQWKFDQGINVEKLHGTLTVKSNRMEVVCIDAFDKSTFFFLKGLSVNAHKCDGVIKIEGGKIEYEYMKSNDCYILSINNESKTCISVRWKTKGEANIERNEGVIKIGGGRMEIIEIRSFDKSKDFFIEGISLSTGKCL